MRCPVAERSPVHEDVLNGAALWNSYLFLLVQTACSSLPHLHYITVFAAALNNDCKGPKQPSRVSTKEMALSD